MVVRDVFFKSRTRKNLFPGKIHPNNSIETFLFDSADEVCLEPDLLRIVLDSVFDSIYSPEIYEMILLSDGDRKSLQSAPGEHYQLLSKLVCNLQVSSALEIGTFRGLGALAISQTLPSKGQVYTNDIIPWYEFSSVLTSEMFSSGKISQILGDFSGSENRPKFIDIFDEVDFVFLDGPKDGLFEYKIIDIISNLNVRKRKFLFVDDIKFLNMIPLWRSIKSPKIDLSSLGHWSGSGFVDISDGLKINKGYWH
jgi:predicted O-methyltransferase YrrM